MELPANAVTKNNGIPISQQIVELILEQVRDGCLQPGERLPTERDLAERLGVSRGTVKSAYKKLEQQGMLQVRQGSGSFIRRDESLVDDVRRSKAAELTNGYIGQIQRLGLKPAEIRELLETYLESDAHKPLDIAVIYNNTEMLLDFKKQLSVLSGVSVSIFILDSITEDPAPERLLAGFSLIVVPSGCHQQVLQALPGLAGRIIEASITPTSDTLIKITALPRDYRIGIISRTSAFLSVVKDMLISYGFVSENILSFFEINYTLDTYFPGGIQALISFSDAHIFTRPDFIFRNEELLAKGGTIISFQYQLEQGSVRHIEERVRQLEQEKKNQQALL